MASVKKLLPQHPVGLKMVEAGQRGSCLPLVGAQGHTNVSELSVRSLYIYIHIIFFNLGFSTKYFCCAAQSKRGGKKEEEKNACWRIIASASAQCFKYILMQYISTKTVQYILKLILFPYHASHSCTLYGLIIIYNVCLMLAFIMSGYFIVYCETGINKVSIYLSIYLSRASGDSTESVQSEPAQNTDEKKKMQTVASRSLTRSFTRARARTFR